MNMADMFNTLGSERGIDQNGLNDNNYNGMYDNNPESVFNGNWGDEYNYLKTTPVMYNMDGYIYPYASSNWGGTSMILKTLEDVSRLPPVSDKVDPNKIFTSDITALNKLASDQQRMTKIFERKLMESLGEKGKIGLTEDDIAAMQAVTSARAAIANINKEKINIKKNIADIRLKQQAAGNGGGNVDPGRSSYGDNDVNVGKSIMDNIFAMPTVPVNNNVAYNAGTVVSEDNLDKASEVIDVLLPDDVDDYTKHESAKPVTYVLVGESNDDVEYATYGSDGELIDDYNNPTTRITVIDRESKTATDELLRTYPIKDKYADIDTDEV